MEDYDQQMGGVENDAVRSLERELLVYEKKQGPVSDFQNGKRSQ